MSAVKWLVAAGIALAAVTVFAGVQTYRLQGAQAENALLGKDLSVARADAEGWRVVSDYRRASADAQADLAEACLIREERYIHDAAEIAAILGMTAEPETAPTLKTGVTDATRRATAAYLNRPL
jgi:hypothetical protein